MMSAARKCPALCMLVLALVSDSRAGDACIRPTVEVIQTLTNGKDESLPKTFSLGRGLQIIGDYVYASARLGGEIHYFKRDAQTGKLAHAGSVVHSSLRSTFSLHAAGGRLYALGLFVWGSADGDKFKGLTWFDLEPGTGKPIEKGTLADLSSPGSFQQLLVGPGEKDLYGSFATPGGLRFVWFRLGEDGKPEKRVEISGAGIGPAACLSSDGKHIYSLGDHRIAVIERKPTGEVAYRKALSLDVLAASKGPGAVDLSHLRPSLAGISPDGRWLYVVLFSENSGTRGRFGVFRRDPASGNLELQEGGPDSDPSFSRFAALDQMSLRFSSDGATGFISNNRCLLKTFRMDPGTGRLSVLSDVVLGKPDEIKCRPSPYVQIDGKRGFMYGTGVWQTGAYGEHYRGIWVAKTGGVAASGGEERADLKASADPSPEVRDAPEGDWPCWRGPAGDGRSPAKGIRKDWSGGLRKLWDVTGLSPGDCTWSSPSIQGNKLVAMGTHGFVDEVLCFDSAKGGRPLWIANLVGSGDIGNSGGRDGWCGGPVVSPYIHGDKVYVVQNVRLSCLRLSDGQLLWQKSVVSACHTYAASPLVWDDLLIVAGVVQPDRKPALLSALRKDTGESVWVYGMGETSGGETPTFGHVTPQRMKINGVEQIVYNTGALACGVDHKTGKAYWEYRYKMTGSNVNASEPVTDGSILAVMLGDGAGRPFGLQIEDQSKATLLWDKIPNFRAMWCAPILKDGHIYVFSADGLYSGPNSDFRCVDLKTGQARWIEKKTGCGSILEVDGHLLCLLHCGDLWLVAPSAEGFRKVTEWKGAIKQEPWWTSNGGKTPAPCWTPPVIAQGRLYLRYMDTLACYDLLK